MIKTIIIDSMLVHCVDPANNIHGKDTNQNDERLITTEKNYRFHIFLTILLTVTKRFAYFFSYLNIWNQ